MLARNIQERLEQALNRFPVVVILGARQSGKTTLARMARPDWSYFDLERGSHFDLITRDFDFFFQEYSNRLIIDETQLSGDLFRELRGVVDADRMHKGRFLLTGSSSADLHRHVSETRFIEQERTPYGIVINNADQVRMLTQRIIQLPAGAI
jgi:predicted AAA+ superfamily ATPase